MSILKKRSVAMTIAIVVMLVSMVYMMELGAQERGQQMLREMDAYLYGGYGYDE